MGTGIAQVAAYSGFEVTLCDVSADQVSRAVANIHAATERQVAKGAISTIAQEAALTRLRGTPDIADVGACDLIIEAATENEAIKVDILIAVHPHLAPHTILTSNTSSLSITRLAAHTDRPEKFMGFHFMNPVPSMPLVELIEGIATSQETYASIIDTVRRLGKTGVKSEDYPAFMVNRILIPMINEAVFALFEGVGTIDDIDAALKLGAAHPMGPLKLADFIGLDTCLAIMNTLYTGFADPKYRPCPLLVKYVEAGWLGRKSGRGFHDYQGKAGTKHQWLGFAGS